MLSQRNIGARVQLLSQRIRRSIPSSSVCGREVVMVCRLLLQTCRLPSTLLLRSSTRHNRKCSRFEFSQNTTTPSSQGRELAAKNVLLGSQTLSSSSRQSDSWTQTQPSYPVFVRTASLFGRMTPCHVTPEHPDPLHSSDYLVLGKAARTSLVDVFCLHGEQLESTLPDNGTQDQPVGKWIPL